jgi:hypothetical protein
LSEGVLFCGERHLAGPLLAVVCVDYDEGLVAEWARGEGVDGSLLQRALLWEAVWLEAPRVDELGVAQGRQRLLEMLAGVRRRPLCELLRRALRDVGRALYRRRMEEWHRLYPQYGWERNLGTATAEHYVALVRYGPVAEVHRLAALRALPTWIYRNQHRVGRTVPAWWRQLYGREESLLELVTEYDRQVRRRRVARLRSRRARF